MNERIRELLVEAREQTREGKWHAPTAVWAEKFAQLIAEDCAKMLDEDSYIMPELGGYAHDIRTRYGVK